MVDDTVVLCEGINRSKFIYNQNKSIYFQVSKIFFSIQLIIMILVKHGKYEKTMEMIDQKMTIG